MSLKYLLLSELANGEKTGYDIVKSFESSVGYFWSATHQQVYRELKQLYRLKLIDLRVQAQVDKPDKKCYTVTPKGLEELANWVKQPCSTIPVRDHLLVKIHAASFVGNDEVIVELQRSREKVKATLETYKSIEAKYYSQFSARGACDSSRTLYIALRKGIIGAESHIRWIDESISICSD